MTLQEVSVNSLLEVRRCPKTTPWRVLVFGGLYIAVPQPLPFLIASAPHRENRPPHRVLRRDVHRLQPSAAQGAVALGAQRGPTHLPTSCACVARRVEEAQSELGRGGSHLEALKKGRMDNYGKR